MHEVNKSNGGIQPTTQNSQTQPDMENAYKLASAIGEVKDEYIIEAADKAPVQATAPARQITFKEPDARAAANAGATTTGTTAKGKPAAKIARPVWQRALGIGGAVAAVAVVGVVAVGIFGTLTTPSPSPVSDTKTTTWSADSVSGESESNGDAVSSFAETSESAMSDVAGDSAKYVGDSTSERMVAEPPVDPGQIQDPAQPFMLTAGLWNDLDNWPFFTNLVSSGRVEFPSYGINPVNRVKATVRNDAGEPMRNETVVLKEGDAIIWTAKTDKQGNAYLFYNDGQHPTEARCGDSWDTITVSTTDESGQGTTSVNDIQANIVIGGGSRQVAGIQVSFIVDTTGSMSDELAYLQKDFVSIAEETAGDNVFFSANFYRDEGDEYVVRSNGFTSDVNQVKSLLSAEYAAGGGDTPEAVAKALTDVIVNNQGWDDNYAHIAFLIFDAPPHKGTDQEIDAAVRAAAAKGIHVVPVVASNAERDTELFGRALAICTGSPYVFLTDDSGIGNSHLEPIIGDYQVEKLHDIIVRLIREQGN